MAMTGPTQTVPHCSFCTYLPTMRGPFWPVSAEILDDESSLGYGRRGATNRDTVSRRQPGLNAQHSKLTTNCPSTGTRPSKSAPRTFSAFSLSVREPPTQSAIAHSGGDQRKSEVVLHRHLSAAPFAKIPYSLVFSSTNGHSEKLL